MTNIFKAVFLFFITSLLISACSNDELVPLYQEQKAGKVVIRAYNGLQDSIQVSLNGKFLVVDKRNAFLKKTESNYEFVFYGQSTKTVTISNKKTKKILHSYTFTTAKPLDTLSFYTKENIWIENILSNKPGTLSTSGRVGYKFIFPSVNQYSKSGYSGALDLILRKTNGQQIGRIENIKKDRFSTFFEFPFSSPPIVNAELVKHGTDESYIPGKKVIFQMVIQNNKSKLIVLEEKADASGVFSGVEGIINLTDYFSF
ncbi:hypothetical protein [Flavobacterium poyangense]|uniref:hypothetical protein n=1 Tax=Flavobacterium poyangense TaxID=2204302 RepID=UPI00142288D6|nr:hypothetical protein [Flavobacterium sp. JXAS1]